MAQCLGFTHITECRPSSVFSGFYSDSNILSCDSLLGIALFVFSASMVVYAVLGYWYVLQSFIALVSREFRRSKFMDVLEKLIRIREEEEADFKVRTETHRTVPDCVIPCRTALVPCLVSRAWLSVITGLTLFRRAFPSPPVCAWPFLSSWRPRGSTSSERDGGWALLSCAPSRA